MPGNGFKVIIVGGSISGISLALMLEKNGIDFVVLEAYPELAPQVGAGLALLPSGFRITDQLGCYEDILKAGQYPVDDFITRDAKGRLLMGVANVRTEVVERHGYPMLFFDRREVIEIMYNHIKDKRKILTSKRVSRVDEHDDKVVVTTEDGAVFEGDLVVGADGMHSTVRKAIEKDSGTKTPPFPADYGAVFGFSLGPSKVAKGEVHVVSSTKRSGIFVASGPDDKTYWCLFFNLDKRYYGNDVPCQGQQGEEKYSRKYYDMTITEDLKFSDLHKTAVKSVATPLHEYIIDKWHSKRCMMIGDAVHKVNPIAGQGGNAALETSAALTNALVKLIKTHGSAKVSRDALDSALEGVQALRKPKTAHIRKMSRFMQELHAEETLFLTAMNRYFLPSVGNNAMIERLCETYPTSVSLDMFDIPSRPRTTPYEDELRHEPKSRAIVSRVFFGALLLGLSTLGWRMLLGLSQANGALALVDKYKETSFIPELGMPIKSVFGFGRFPGFDQFVKTFTAAFLPVVSGAESFATKIQASYFLIAFYLPVLAIMTVEGYRTVNGWTLLSSPSLWTGLAQLFSAGVILPVYVLIAFFHSRTTSYWMPSSQAIPRPIAAALLPALLVGYFLPSVLMVALNARSPLIQETITIWQLSPMLITPIAKLFIRPSPIPPTATITAPPEKYIRPPSFRTNPNHALHRIYTTVFALSAFIHLATLAYLVRTPALSLVATFIPSAAEVDPTTAVQTVAQGMGTFFKFDFLFATAAVFVWCVTTIVDLRRVGVAETAAWRSVLGLCAGFVMVGPGAAAAALWRRREEVVGGFRPRTAARAERA